MKKIYSLALIGIFACITKMQAYDFTAPDVNGNTIYYNYLGGDSVEVTFMDYNYNSYNGYVVIPSTVNNGTSSFQVRRIGEYAFNRCRSLNSIEIPNSVTDIETTAFVECYSLASFNVDANNPNYCSIDSVLFSKDLTILIKCPATKHGVYSIPNTVTSFGYNAFEYCSNLTSVYIGSNVAEIIGDNFFACTKLDSIIVESTNPNFSSVDGILFNKDCTVLKLFPGAREGKYVIPNRVVCIDRYAFNYSKLTDLTVPNSITSIRSDAFHSSSNMNFIILPDSLTELGNGAFINCINLKSVNIPDKITEVSSWTFGYCSRLQSIDIPKNITTIGDHALYSCSNLDTVICRRKTPPLIGTDAFKYISENAILFVPYDSISIYKNINEYSDCFAEIKGFSDVGAVTDTSAILKWIPDTAVSQYNINVYTGGTLFAHYEVDSVGQIISSQRFAPSIYHHKLDTTTSSTEYFVISLEGLSAGTDYDYTIDGTNAQSAPVYHEEGSFRTDWPEGIILPFADDPRKQTGKILRDGMLYIIRPDGTIFNATGVRVR